MLLGQADLSKKVSKLELKQLKESKSHPTFMLELEALLLDVYASLLPTASDYKERNLLIHVYNMTVKSIFGNTGGFPVVEAFGSFIMDIFTAKSDLDLSINFNYSNARCFPPDQVVFVLRRLAKVFYQEQRKGHLSGVLPVLHARVPVLKAVDCMTGIECDISVENKDGISRSLFFSIISSIDQRFRIISYLMKAWAKANDINSSKDHTMNSLSIISLVAFHFQTRDPPILPPFSTLLRDGPDISNLRNVVLAFKNFGYRNKESVAELFVALLDKLSSVEKLWEVGLCASIFEGSWISKKWGSKIGNMSIEDFLDRSQNFARSVGKSQMAKIYDCLRRSLDKLSHSMRGQTELSALRCALFGSISCESARPHVYTHTTNHPNRNAATTLKRKLPSNELADPRFDATTHAGSSSTTGFESNQPPFKKITSKRTSNLASHQNQSTGYLHPVVPYVSPQPINVIAHPHSSFDPPSHPHLIYASQHNPMAPVHPAYRSQGPHYFPNPAHHPIFLGYITPDTKSPQYFAPSRWSRSNHS